MLENLLLIEICETNLLLLFSWLAVSNSATPWIVALHTSLPFPVSKTLFRLIFTESRDSSMSNQLNFFCPLLLLHSVFAISESIMFQDKVEYQSFLICRLAKVLELYLQHQSFQRIFSYFLLGLSGLIFLLSKGLSRVTFGKTGSKPQFFGTQPSLSLNPHIHTLAQFSSVHSLSHFWLFVTTWNTGLQASLSIANTQSLPKLMPIECAIPYNHLIFCHPLVLLPSIFPRIRVFSSESALLIRWTTYWNFSFNISLWNEHPGLISLRWTGCISCSPRDSQSFLQHHSSKTSIILCPAFYIVQLSHPYMTPGKTIALTRQTFVVKVMPLLFNILLKLVITFLPKRKNILISWLQSPSAVIWAHPPPNK